MFCRPYYALCLGPTAKVNSDRTVPGMCLQTKHHVGLLPPLPGIVPAKKVAHTGIIATAGYAAFGGPTHLGRALGTWYQVPYFDFGRPYSYQR